MQFWQKGQPVAPVLPPQCLGNGGSWPRCPRVSGAPECVHKQAKFLQQICMNTCKILIVFIVNGSWQWE
jgi:hypothetical protein